MRTNLPELHLDGVLELAEACLQMHGLTVRVVQVDGPLFVLVLVHVTQMRAQLKNEMSQVY